MNFPPEIPTKQASMMKAELGRQFQAANSNGVYENW
jgi:hypothetical protein